MPAVFGYARRKVDTEANGMAKSKKGAVNRRSFLKGAAAGAAALVSKPAEAAAQEARPAGVPARAAEAAVEGRPSADFMVDVIKSLGFEYLCANPGSSFAGIHESIINYGGNKSPEFI